MNTERRKYIVVTITTLLTVVYSIVLNMLNYPTSVNNATAILALSISAYLLYAVRHRADLLIVMLCIFYENYSVVVGCYLNPSIRPDWMFRQFKDSQVYGKAILSLLVFELVLLAAVFLYKEKIDSEEIDIEQYPNNNLIMLGCIALYLIIFLTQVDFSEGKRASSNVINEYKFVLLIVGSLYSKKTNLNRRLWTGIVGITSIATFFGGNRVNTLCNIFVLAILWFENYITLKNVILISIPSIFVMLMIGSMRYNFTISVDSIQTVWETVKTDKLVADSFTFAYGPTIAAEEMSLNLGIWQKVQLLFYNIIYVFIGGKYGKYSLSNYTRDYYMHYFGFLGANYFDMWFGVFGGAIAGVSVVLMLFLKGKGNKESTQVGKVVALGVLANTLRWYNYNFMQIYRTAFVILIVWYASSYANSMLARKTTKQSN
mgnify:CR=1 FL=1